MGKDPYNMNNQSFNNSSFIDKVFPLAIVGQLILPVSKYIIWMGKKISHAADIKEKSFTQTVQKVGGIALIAIGTLAGIFSISAITIGTAGICFYAIHLLSNAQMNIKLLSVLSLAVGLFFGKMAFDSLTIALYWEPKTSKNQT